MSWTSTTPGDTAVSDEAPTPGAKRVRCRLQSVGDVRAELAKVYREARSGLLGVDHASKLAHILSTIARTIADDDLDQMRARIATLEARHAT